MFLRAILSVLVALFLLNLVCSSDNKKENKTDISKYKIKNVSHLVNFTTLSGKVLKVGVYCKDGYVSSPKGCIKQKKEIEVTENVTEVNAVNTTAGELSKLNNIELI